MTERRDESPIAVRPGVVRDLELQRRRNGWRLTATLLGIIVLFRWLSEGPFAGNSIRLALVLVVIGMRAADHRMARTVARTVARFAGLLADTDAPPTVHQ